MDTAPSFFTLMATGQVESAEVRGLYYKRQDILRMLRNNTEACCM